MAENVKQDENGRKIENLLEPGNRNKIKLMKTDGELNEEKGASQIQNPEQQKKREFVTREIQFKNKYSQKWPECIQND